MINNPLLAISINCAGQSGPWLTTSNDGQECIQVGCIPTTSVAILGVSAKGVSAVGVCPAGVYPGGCLPGGCPEGVYLGVSAHRGYTPSGSRGRHPHCMLGYTPPAHCMLGYIPSPVNRMTDRRKSITFPQLRLRAVITICLSNHTIHISSNDCSFRCPIIYINTCSHLY